MNPQTEAKLRGLVDELLSSGVTLDEAKWSFEQTYIERAISRSRGSVSDAARKLGVHRNTVHGKLRQQARG
jgi:DNA-binding NtrC family response regulator